MFRNTQPTREDLRSSRVFHSQPIHVDYLLFFTSTSLILISTLPPK